MRKLSAASGSKRSADRTGAARPLERSTMAANGSLGNGGKMVVDKEFLAKQEKSKKSAKNIVSAGEKKVRTRVG